MESKQDNAKASEMVLTYLGFNFQSQITNYKLLIKNHKLPTEMEKELFASLKENLSAPPQHTTSHLPLLNLKGSPRAAILIEN